LHRDNADNNECLNEELQSKLNASEKKEVLYFVIQSKHDSVRTLVVALLFGVAMAWMEAATVVYLRAHLGRMEPYQVNPMPGVNWWESTELVRELATLIMLATAGWLAGKTWRSRLGFFLVMFGIWDIFYYVFLHIICGWPKGLLDWDILFLLPLPWWGPVIAPMLIAGLMVLGGGLVGIFDTEDSPFWPGKQTIALNLLGVGIGLYVFMTDAIRTMPQGAEAVRQVLPEKFNWLLFLLGLALMSAPVVELIIRSMHFKKRCDHTDQL